MTTHSCTIFCDAEMNCSEELLYLIDYQPYRIYGDKNPDFDEKSRLILDLKGGQEHAIKWALGLVNPWLSKNFAISVVPSHDAAAIDSPIKELARRIVAADSTRIDAIECLVRHATIQKLAHGGARSIEVHLDSIRVEKPELIRAKQVLILDDVQTTGNSLRACVQLIQEAGATFVRPLSISKTVGY